MKQYWLEFINEYESRISHVSLLNTLEAFYYYCNKKEKKCDEIMYKLKEE